jgi:hypothetical protein
MTEECKEAYWNSVYDLLHASNAVNESTALLLSFVGARCHKPNALRATKATQCLRESGMFHIAEFPATGRDRIWLLPQRTKPNVHVKVKAQVAPKVKASATVTPPAMATKPLPAVLCDTTTSSCMAPGGSHEEFYWRTVYMILDSKRAIGQDNAVPLELILGNHGNPNAVQSLQVGRRVPLL